jgi:hypothetical protein
MNYRNSLMDWNPMVSAMGARGLVAGPEYAVSEEKNRDDFRSGSGALIFFPFDFSLMSAVGVFARARVLQASRAISA